MAPLPVYLLSEHSRGSAAGDPLPFPFLLREIPGQREASPSLVSQAVGPTGGSASAAQTNPGVPQARGPLGPASDQ